MEFIHEKNATAWDTHVNIKIKDVSNFDYTAQLSASLCFQHLSKFYDLHNAIFNGTKMFVKPS